MDRPGGVDDGRDDPRRVVRDDRRLHARDRCVALGRHDADALAVQRADERVVIDGEVQEDVGELAGQGSRVGDVGGGGADDGAGG